MKEHEIRPKELFSRYLELSLRDARAMDRTGFVRANCPGCGGGDSRPKFQKNDFAFEQCQACGSLFCSPRPTPEALNSFYRQSESARYWSEVFLPAVEESRREKLFRKKAQQIKELVAGNERAVATICEVGAGYGILLEELRTVFPRASFHAVEPNGRSAAKCRSKGFETLEQTAEDAAEWQGRFDLVVSAEVIEHVFSPPDFVRAMCNLTAPGGRVVLTGLGYEGFDILLLQEHSNSIFPPHHLNFLSIAGYRSLFERTGLEGVSVWTPGELDVDIVLNSGRAPEFLKVLSQRPGAASELQDLLRKHMLSSHTWAYGRRRRGALDGGA